MKRIDLAYAAGIIDGEGYIGIGVHHRPHHRLSVTVGMTDSLVPTWLWITFGGSLNEYQRHHVGWRSIWVWRICDRQAGEFLPQILPYLKVKREHAKLAIQFQKLKAPQGKYGKYRPKPTVVIEAGAILDKELRKLNRRP